MNINRLLNPVPNKKSRFDEGTLVCDKYWLPTELIAYIMTFFLFIHRPKFKLVSRQWYTAYEQYHRNKMFGEFLYTGRRSVMRKQVMNAFVKYGRRLRWMRIHTSSLREILDIEPNFADLIPNAIFLCLVITDGLSSQRYMGDFVAKLSKLRQLTVKQYGSTPDEHLAEEMDKAVANMPCLREADVSDIDLDSNAFPGPNMKARASQIQKLVMSVANIEPESVATTFEALKNVKWLGFRGISSVEVLREVAEIVSNPKNFPAMYELEVHSEFDLSHAYPVVNDDGTKVTAMNLYLKICSIRRPRLVLTLGFILGACSKTDSVLIDMERRFIINLGKTGADILGQLELTHYRPSGDYDPLTALFYESAPRFPRLLFLLLHVSPTTATGRRIIDALNNPFLLPHLIGGYFYVDGTQSPEWSNGFNPIDPSRGVSFRIFDKQLEDEARRLNEDNNGVVPSMFLPDDSDDL
ncbi:hypothetical protein GQ42DRAFT_175953 [Ramicandelaber brevisporus]|nr:hypothetical protein GQ42DRAFT_175953 [Ramicandelaber brevisporus]